MPRSIATISLQVLRKYDRFTAKLQNVRHHFYAILNRAQHRNSNAKLDDARKKGGDVCSHQFFTFILAANQYNLKQFLISFRLSFSAVVTHDRPVTPYKNIFLCTATFHSTNVTAV